MGFKCFFVIEMPSELPLILERAAELGIKPLLGLRINSLFIRVQYINKFFKLVDKLKKLVDVLNSNE